MSNTSNSRTNLKEISDQEALQHIQKMDRLMRRKSMLNLVLIILLLASIGINVAQFLNVL